MTDNQRVTPPRGISGKSRNAKLHKAKAAKNDEFYTLFEVVNEELKYYRDYFKGKTVFCNCDDPEYSNFYKWFHLNFNELGLKRLITTHFDSEKPTYAIDITEYIENPPHIPLKRDGDFRNPECIELLKQADVVVTNPPFALFREFVAQLVEYKKDFLILGHINAITYKEIFPLIKENKLWLGVSITSGDREFKAPAFFDPARCSRIDENGQKYAKVMGVRWYTNLDHKKRHKEIDLCLKYTPEAYPHYDNYDAINVNKVAEIPCDYDGVMGVPISFMDKYNPNQFEILGCSYSYGEPVGYHNDGAGFNVNVNGKSVYKRLFIRRKHNED